MLGQHWLRTIEVNFGLPTRIISVADSFHIGHHDYAVTSQNAVTA